jgi:hypothetical protein
LRRARPGTTTTSRLTKSEFVAKADALCHTIVVKTHEMPEPKPTATALPRT